MSKLVQIENTLKQLSPAGFQRLCDSYLYARGYQNINPIGLVIGAEKTLQGTPDTLFSQSDGRYIFVECSTQQEGLREKFADDLRKCFDPAKTGIPLDRISEVVLCHNSRLDASDEYELADISRGHGVLLSICGLGTIAHDLYQKYPGLTKDVLGLDVDTGQIVPLEHFVTNYSKSTLATPLNTTFQFRSDEMEKALSVLESEDLLLIAGHAGVGKTRFAVECCRRYAEVHPEAKTWCIYNRGADLFQDLRVYFRPPGHYVILVDDANRVSGFKYILQLLHDQRDDQKIKIVVTVRDYALDATVDTARAFSQVLPIGLTAFTENQIKEIIRTQFNIINSLYVERIIDLAQGNPRIAIMAASIARREGTLQSIDDVSSLYGEYFRSVREDLSDFGDPLLLRVAGLIAFFRVVDRSNGELMGTISDAFGIDSETFWMAARQLHHYEVVDMYEDEIVRVSDQVLSTYLFYLSVFQEQCLDFDVLLEAFFPRYRYRLIDAINSVLSAFNKKQVPELLRGHVDRVWSLFQQREDVSDFWHLIDAFWFVKQTDTLLYVRDSIRALRPQVLELSGLTFAPSSQTVPQATILSALGNFSRAGKADRCIALSLLIDYLERRPGDASLVIRTLTERFGISRHSLLYGFSVECSAVDVLWERAHGGMNPLVSRVLLVISEALLQTHFRIHESAGDSAITIYEFDLPDTDELIELRKDVWNHVFTMYNVPFLRESVLELFRKHIQAERRSAHRVIIAREAPLVQTFFAEVLEPTVYSHCVIVHDYLDMLERIRVDADKSLRAHFTNETFQVSALVLDDRNERRGLGWDEYERLQQERLAQYTMGFSSADYDALFTRCSEILECSVRSHSEFQIQRRVDELLLCLADRDRCLYETVLGTYLRSGNKLNLGPWVLAAKLIEVKGADRAYALLSSGEYPGKVSWLFGYFGALPPEAVTTERLELLYRLYETTSGNELVGGMDYLLKFTRVDGEVIVRVTRIVTERAASDLNFGRALSNMFTAPSDLVARLREIFAREIDLVKQAYFIACSAAHHTDFDGQAFNVLLDLDPKFGGEWIQWKLKGEFSQSRYDDSRDYSFIWRRDDYAAVITAIIKAAHNESGSSILLFPYIDVFFTTREGDPNAEMIRNKQDAFVDRLLQEDSAFTRTLFRVICEMPAPRRRERIMNFVGRNQNFEIFKVLPLEPSSWGWSGSAVPMLQQRVDFFESLLPILNSVELLQHRQRIEQIIQRLQEEIEREKKKDFMND